MRRPPCCSALALSVYIALRLPQTPEAAAATFITRPCPCDDEALCEPIAGPPVKQREVFGFYGGAGDGSDMNWTHVSTVAWVTDDSLTCLAHKHGAKVVLASPPFDLNEMMDPTLRASWIDDTLSLVLDRFADGIVFDYENPQPPGSLAGHAYATLIAETRDALQTSNPSYQISTCVPWSPDNIDGRAYPWMELAEASDLLYVMDYDTRSQIFDACIASANAPFPGMVWGIQRWLDLGIAPTKLVLGVPWYGYRYRCLPGTPPDAIYCPIEKVAFRGINCSDAAGIEVAHRDIIKVFRSTNATVTGGLRRDTNMDAPFFNAIVNQTTVYQYWYDDTASLENKFRWAQQHHLRGIGPYTFNYLDPADSAAMWSTFDVFMESLETAVV